MKFVELGAGSFSSDAADHRRPFADHLMWLASQSWTIKRQVNEWKFRRSPGWSNSLNRLVTRSRRADLMSVKKLANSEQDTRYVTPIERSVFYDLFSPEKAAELEMRA